MVTTEMIEKEIQEEIEKKDCKEFLQYLGIQPDDYDDLYDSIDFDDFSN